MKALVNVQKLLFWGRYFKQSGKGQLLVLVFPQSKGGKKEERKEKKSGYQSLLSQLRWGRHAPDVVNYYVNLPSVFLPPKATMGRLGDPGLVKITFEYVWQPRRCASQISCQEKTCHSRPRSSMGWQPPALMLSGSTSALGLRPSSCRQLSMAEVQRLAISASQGLLS